MTIDPEQNADGLHGVNALLAEVNQLVGCGGDLFKQTRETVTLEEIRRMAESVGDCNPAYSNVEFARTSVFGTLVAPPYSALSWFLENWIPVAAANWTDDQGVRRYRQDPNPKRKEGAIISEEQRNQPFNLYMNILEKAGYTSVAITDGDVEFVRQIRVGDHLSFSDKRLESVAGPKKTKLGEGFFSTDVTTAIDQRGEVVFRITLAMLLFKPKS